ncbi:hypothetical protein Aple_037320 [Acrocarpospora pleiomorpha]|uniref:Zinc finger CGNR domain-containing protein n=1 Tax=Acrocarpospora pleiomorpha TaxID=90975 RepID=A0A5M3XJH0_9ACTN|nr:CGNR zinc finger domain-containing protein [Acrocarpospora pleiomorpha]GES20836.1 hypothetical protein Aple_037320 [Acrocarpospora pleiomorpha]
MNFNSHSDMVVAIAVALVNVLTPGERRGRPYKIPEGEQRREAVAEAVRARREVTDEEAAELAGYAPDLRAVFEAVAAGDLDHAAGTLNRLLVDTRARPHLSRHDGEPWHVHFHGTDGTFGGDYAASCATGLAIVLGSELHDRLGVCTADRCDRVYVDVSRNGTRRFCSTACQNRVKTAAFRART